MVESEKSWQNQNRTGFDRNCEGHCQGREIVIILCDNKINRNGNIQSQDGIVKELLVEFSCLLIRHKNKTQKLGFICVEVLVTNLDYKN